jgi:hypothetical protein
MVEITILVTNSIKDFFAAQGVKLFRVDRIPVDTFEILIWN